MCNMKRILFVCLGNICRSPTGEAVFTDLAAQAGLSVTSDSAGTSDWHIGHPPYEPMIGAAAQRGYDLSNLRARQITPSDFHKFDLIIGMDGENIRNIERLRPAKSTTPVHLMMDYAPGAGCQDVPDPFYTRNFDEALDLIELANQGLIASIVQS